MWFITAADAGVLTRDYGMSHPPALGRVLLDNALVISSAAGHQGRIGLHATRAGGEALLQTYRACGLINLPKSAPMLRHFKRKNDGRFFYADDATALGLLQKLNPYC